MNNEYNCSVCGNWFDIEEMLTEVGNKHMKIECCHCYNDKMQAKKYYHKICEYISQQLGTPRIYPRIFKDLKELRSYGLNNKEILYIIYYTWIKKGKLNPKYNKNINIVFFYIDEALEHAKNNDIDLYSPDKDYFNETKEERIKIDKHQFYNRIKCRKGKEYKSISKNSRTLHPEFSEEELELYLVDNIELIEDGMQYIRRQYRIKSGIIDILAKDKHDNICVIELKVDDKCRRLLYQCKYYPQAFNEEDVRMITITPSYPEDIKQALINLGYVEMYTYNVNFNKNKLESLTINKECD